MLKKIFLSEKIILAVITINALVVFLQTFRGLNKSFWYFLWVIDYFIAIFFIIEIIVKMKTYTVKGYFSDGWNVFDFIVIVLSLPSLAALYFNTPGTTAVLLFRLARIIRLFRFIHFIPHLNKLLAGLGRALKSAFFILLVLLLYNFILAVFTCHLYRDIAPEHFGDPVISLYTIFKLFTMEGWNEIPETIAKNSSYWSGGLARLYFVLIALTGGLFGMSLANAIFVDEMIVDNNQELETKIDELNNKIDRMEALLSQNNRQDKEA